VVNNSDSLNLGLHDITISFWMKTTDTDFGYTVTKYAGGGARGYGTFVELSPLKIRAEIYPEGGSDRLIVNSTISIGDNQ